MIIVNLFAGPGAGKSTTAAGMFFQLKSRGYNAERVTEYAKDLTWERRHDTLKCQAYVFGKQLHRLERLKGQVDIIVNDSPVVLSSIYAPIDYAVCWHDFVLSRFRSFKNRNYFIERVKPYSPVGRSQNEEQAKQVDDIVRNYLRANQLPFTSVLGDLDAPNRILADLQGSWL